MTVHINGSKGKDLYYGGTKIKEAYYGSTKVYSSGPLYYCYSYDYGGARVYAYTKNDYGNSLPKGVQIYGIPPYGFDKATSASQLSDMGLSGDISFPRYPSGDLYT